ncbi:MAG: hypothetical protein JNM09_01815 [Blastocatellia bacterium]|nr:hypothetical protein [Blastocatellia bacterium]
MGLFSRKEKYTLQGFCQHYFHLTVLQTEDCYTLIEKLKNSDGQFTDNEIESAAFELLAIRMELFALAWNYVLRSDDYIVSQSIFTKEYLDSLGASSLWESMAEYNKTVSASRRFTSEGEPLSKMDVLKLDQAMLAWFTRMHNKGYDDECIGRSANRLRAGMKSDNTQLFMSLADKFCHRLQVVPSFQVTHELIQAFYDFYETSKADISKVKITLN